MPPRTSLVRAADLALVYGGQDVADRYAGDPTVLINGPGRTKILITAEQDWREHLDVIVDSIAGLGGMACVNATAVLYEGDAAGSAQAVAQRLSTIDDALLPTMPVDEARALAAGSPGRPPARCRCSAPIRWSPKLVMDAPCCVLRSIC